jgi:Ca2+-binding EF-hand superfamily protein
MPREHRSTVKRKFKHWQKTRQAMVDKIGADVMAAQDEKLSAKIAEIFNLFDDDGDGGIDEQELKKGMLALGVTLSQDEVKTMLVDADSDGDGFIQLAEFEEVVRTQVKMWENAKKSMMCDIL